MGAAQALDVEFESYLSLISKRVSTTTLARCMQSLCLLIFYSSQFFSKSVQKHHTINESV